MIIESSPAREMRRREKSEGELDLSIEREA